MYNLGAIKRCFIEFFLLISLNIVQAFMGDKMKLSKHQKKIVDAIINGTVYDIPSYLKTFQKWQLCKYNLTRPTERFKQEQGGKQYKVIIDREKAYIKSSTPMKMGFMGTVNVTNEFLKNPEDIPSDAWEYREAELILDIKPIEIEYFGKTFSFDFMEAGVNVANDFDDIVEFMSLWAYLRQESLVLEVPKDITSDDIGILFELKQKAPKKDNPFIIHKDTISESSTNPIERIIIDVSEFYPSPPMFQLSSYIDEEWVLNNEYKKTCEEYIGKKILPTEKLRVFTKQLYTTSNEWQYRIPLIISVIALIVSFLPIIQSLIPSDEPDYISQINQHVEKIETLIESDVSDDSELDIIQKRLTEILKTLTEINSTEKKEKTTEKTE